MPAVAVFASFVFAAIFMPETYGLSLDEIKAIYATGEIEVHTLYR